MQKYKKRLIMILGLLIGGNSCFALQTYPLIDHQRTSITISQTEQNRIAVLGDRIQQVFGADGAFDIQSDEEGGQIFLKIASEFQQGSRSSKPTTITIITESGLTQDLRLIPKFIEFQSVLFKPHFLSQEEREDHREAFTRLQPIINLMRAMARNEVITGYTKSSFEQQSAPSSSLPKELKSELLFIYKGDQFEGKIYTLTNQGNESVDLKEQDFALKEDVAIHIPKNTLHPQEAIILYKVSRLALGQETRGRAQ